MRMNIYVPDALHDRMKKAKDINWSEVAQRAFELKLGEIAAVKSKLNMNDVIDRLRASKSKGITYARKQGVTAGDGWAKRKAEYNQIEALARLRDEVGLDWDKYRSHLVTSIPKLLSENNQTGQDNIEFWQEVAQPIDYPFIRESEENNGEFAEGFLEGVENVWDAVKDEV